MAFRCRRTVWSHNRWGLFLGIVLGLTIHAHAQDIRQCTAENKQCLQDLETERGTSTSGPSCEACHNTCTALLDRAKASNNEPLANRSGLLGWRCRNACAENNCVGNSKNDANVSEFFRCDMHNRRCWVQHNKKSRNSSAIREFCGICATTCSNVRRSSTKWCEARCEEYNTTCSASSNTNTSSPISTPSVPPGGALRSPAPRPTSASGTKPKDTDRAELKGGSPKLWDWLGPVLGSVATIIAAVITVLWVRDYRQPHRTTGKAASETGTVNGEYDEGWPYQNGTVGISHGIEQSSQRPTRFPWCFRATDSVSSGQQ